MGGRDDAVVARWPADGAFAYRAALGEGIGDVVKMTSMALASMGGIQHEGACADLSYRFLSLGTGDGSQGGAEPEHAKGTVVQEDGKRIIFRTDEGDFFSLPTSAIAGRHAC